MTQHDFLTRENVQTSEPSRQPRWWTLRKFESNLDTLLRTVWREAPDDFPLPAGMSIHDVYGTTVGVIEHGPFHITWSYDLHGGFTYKSRVDTIMADMKDGSVVTVLDCTEGRSELAKDSPAWSALRQSLKDMGREIGNWRGEALAARTAKSHAIDRSLS